MGSGKKRSEERRRSRRSIRFTFSTARLDIFPFRDALPLYVYDVYTLVMHAHESARVQAHDKSKGEEGGRVVSRRNFCRGKSKMSRRRKKMYRSEMKFLFRLSEREREIVARKEKSETGERFDTGDRGSWEKSNGNSANRREERVPESRIIEIFLI